MITRCNPRSFTGYILVLGITILVVQPSYAQQDQTKICGTPPSFDVTRESNDTTKGDLTGKAQALSKLIGNAELGAKIKSERKTIYQTSDNSEAIRKDAYLAYIFCTLIMQDKNASLSDKLEALQRFKEPPPGKGSQNDGAPRSIEEQTKYAEQFPWQDGTYSGPVTQGKPNGPDGILNVHDGRGFTWTYRGNFMRGVRDGEGKITISLNDGERITLTGHFENNTFMSGRGQIEYRKPYAFELRTSESGNYLVYGTYDGEVINKNPESHRADGFFWRNLIAEGQGTLTGQIENTDPTKMYTLIWAGIWKHNGFVGVGVVTYPDGGYEEGLFHYWTLVEGKVVSKSSHYRWGVRLTPPIVYSGGIRNGRPQGEGSMSSDDLSSFPVKLVGTFNDGEIVTGNGYRPSCSKKGGCTYGAVGEFRNGDLFTGHETVPVEGNDGFVILEYEMKEGKVLNHSSHSP